MALKQSRVSKRKFMRKHLGRKDLLALTIVRSTAVAETPIAQGSRSHRPHRPHLPNVSLQYTTIIVRYNQCEVDTGSATTAPRCCQSSGWKRLSRLGRHTTNLHAPNACLVIMKLYATTFSRGSHAASRPGQKRPLQRILDALAPGTIKDGQLEIGPR